MSVPTYGSIPGTPLISRYGIERTGRSPAKVNRSLATIFADAGSWSNQSSGSGATQSVDTTDFVRGTQSLSYVSNGAGTQSATRSPVYSAFDSTNKCIQLMVKITGLANLQKIAIAAFSGSTSNSYQWTFQHGTDLFPSCQDGVWTNLTLSFADAGTAGSPTRSNITQFQFNLFDNGGAVTVSAKYNEISFVPDGSAQYPNGVVSVTCDDGFLSQSTLLRATLDKYGYQATAFIIRNIIDNPSYPSYMSTANLRQLHDQNKWEIAAHANTLADHNTTNAFVGVLQNSGQGALDADLANLKQWLIANDFSEGSNILALPQGAYNIDPNGAVSVYTEVKRYFEYVRTIYSSQGQYKETLPPYDPHTIRAISGISEYPGAVSPATIVSYINSVVANKAWGIVVFHCIVPNVTSVTMSGNIATIVFNGTIPGNDRWVAGTTQVVLAGFTPAGLNGTFTIASKPTASSITVNIGSNPGNSTIQGTCLASSLECTQAGADTICAAIQSSGAENKLIGDVMRSMDIDLTSKSYTDTKSPITSPTFTGTVTAPKLVIPVGSNANAGTGTLTGGTVTISTTAVTANSLIFLTDTSGSVTNVGNLTVSAKSAGVSFTVTSTNVLDVSTFNWLIVN